MTPDDLLDYLINTDQYQIPLARQESDKIFDWLSTDDDAPLGTYSMELVREAVELAQDDPIIQLMQRTIL